MWLERPGGFFWEESYGERQLYTERQLFYGVVRMSTPRRARPGRHAPS